MIVTKFTFTLFIYLEFILFSIWFSVLKRCYNGWKCIVYDNFDNDVFAKPLNNLKVMPVNIGSFRKNTNLSIANIHNVKRDIDIIIMSEMWIF